MGRQGLGRALAAALALAAPAAGGAVERGAGAPPAVELVAPAPGARLEAGGQLAVEWRPRAGSAPRFEEWEVFLSLDGGVTWPFRLTQHLDAARRRAIVDLPPIPAARARFLFRFGDERQETELELPGSFELRAARAPLFGPARRIAAGRGEAARPRLPGVAWWVEGPRDGRDRRLWVAGETEAGWRAGTRLDAAAPALACAEPDSERPPIALPAGLGRAAPLAPALQPFGVALDAAPRTLDRLALQVRRNE